MAGGLDVIFVILVVGLLLLFLGFSLWSRSYGVWRLLSRTGLLIGLALAGLYGNRQDVRIALLGAVVVLLWDALISTAKDDPKLARQVRTGALILLPAVIPPLAMGFAGAWLRGFGDTAWIAPSTAFFGVYGTGTLLVLGADRNRIALNVLANVLVVFGVMLDAWLSGTLPGPGLLVTSAVWAAAFVMALRGVVRNRANVNS